MIKDALASPTPDMIRLLCKHFGLTDAMARLLFACTYTVSLAVNGLVPFVPFIDMEAAVMSLFLGGCDDAVTRFLRRVVHSVTVARIHAPEVCAVRIVLRVGDLLGKNVLGEEMPLPPKIKMIKEIDFPSDLWPDMPGQGVTRSGEGYTLYPLEEECGCLTNNVTKCADCGGSGKHVALFSVSDATTKIDELVEDVLRSIMPPADA